MKPAIGYIRVSTGQQADTGLGLDDQRHKIRLYAELQGLELVGIEEDTGESAKTLLRPGLIRAVEALVSGRAEALVVAKLDRLTRSVRHLGELVERYFAGGKWALLSVSESIDTRTAAGRLVLNVLASVAQWEREAIGERTRAALAVKRARGERLGGKPPIGTRMVNGALVRDVHELAGVDLARKLHREHRSLGEISRELEVAGFLNRHGNPYATMQIHRMVVDKASKVG